MAVYVVAIGEELFVGECPGRIFFLEGIIQEGTERGGTVRMGVMSGGELSGGNCPGGSLPVTSQTCEKNHI